MWVVIEGLLFTNLLYLRAKHLKKSSIMAPSTALDSSVRTFFVVNHFKNCFRLLATMVDWHKNFFFLPLSQFIKKDIWWGSRSFSAIWMPIVRNLSHRRVTCSWHKWMYVWTIFLKICIPKLARKYQQYFFYH